MQVKDSKVKSESPNIILPCFFFLYYLTCNLTFIKEFTYLVFFGTCILVFLSELRKIVKIRVNFRKIVNFYTLYFITCNILQVKYSKVKSETPNIILACFYFYFLSSL